MSLLPEVNSAWGLQQTPSGTVVSNPRTAAGVHPSECMQPSSCWCFGLMAPCGQLPEVSANPAVWKEPMPPSQQFSSIPLALLSWISQGRWRQQHLMLKKWPWREQVNIYGWHHIDCLCLLEYSFFSSMVVLSLFQLSPEQILIPF